MIGLLIEKASALVEDSPFLALFIIFLLGMLVSSPFSHFDFHNPYTHPHIHTPMGPSVKHLPKLPNLFNLP